VLLTSFYPFSVFLFFKFVSYCIVLYYILLYCTASVANKLYQKCIGSAAVYLFQINQIKQSFSAIPLCDHHL